MFFLRTLIPAFCKHCGAFCKHCGVSSSSSRWVDKHPLPASASSQLSQGEVRRERERVRVRCPSVDALSLSWQRRGRPLCTITPAIRTLNSLQSASSKAATCRPTRPSSSGSSPTRWAWPTSRRRSPGTSWRAASWASPRRPASTTSRPRPTGPSRDWIQ